MLQERNHFKSVRRQVKAVNFKTNGQQQNEEISQIDEEVFEEAVIGRLEIFNGLILNFDKTANWVFTCLK